MSPFTRAQYSYSSNAAKQISSGEGPLSLLELANKTSVQCRSQSSFYTSESMYTNQMLHSGSEVVLCLQDKDLQAMIRNTMHSFKFPAELFCTHSQHIGSATAAAEARIPVKIIKAMGRWSSDCYCSYICTPYRILRSLTSKLCAS